jgi:GNAT superfamily N-acetyltransferase
MHEGSKPALGARLSSTFQIRERRPHELADCVEAVRLVHQTDRYPTLWPDDPERWLRPSRFLAAWVAVAGAKIAGHISLTLCDDTTDELVLNATSRKPAQLAEIARLFVHPALRRHGIGTQLLDHATQYAQKQGLLPFLTVGEHRESTAVRVYEKRGWRYVGTAPGDYVLADGSRRLLHYYVAP